jgi:hypothetical protein
MVINIEGNTKKENLKEKVNIIGATVLDTRVVLKKEFEKEKANGYQQMETNILENF